MGDDGAYCINDLPKVTSTISSEAITNTDAFDMMVRFLSKHQFRYPNSGSNNNSDSSQKQEHQHQPQEQRFGHVYHFWEDLYHVTETLATSSSSNIGVLESRQQQETLRKLRLVAASTSAEEVADNRTVTAVKSEPYNERDNVLRVSVAQTSDLNNDDLSENVVVKNEDVGMHKKHKISKADKREKKKEKKRKRESA